MITLGDRHLTLLGLMGSGKSTVGERLARALGRPFLDLDAAIVAEYGPIAEIFGRDGEAQFRTYEHTVLVRALAQPLAVISPGGGAVTHESTRTLLAQTTRVYLDVPLPVLVRRLKHSAVVRPLIGTDPALSRVTELWTARHGLYEEAEIRIGGDFPVDTVVEMILRALGRRWP